jgi:hypothetical protein
MPITLSQMRGEAASARRAVEAAAMKQPRPNLSQPNLSQPSLSQPDLSRHDPSTRGMSYQQQRALIASLVKPMKRAGKPADPKPAPPSN